MKRIRILAFTAAAALAVVAAPALRAGDISNTVHNLSNKGPGATKSSTEGEVCVFCHTPHKAVAPQQPLWNRKDPGTTYTTYRSSTMKVVPGQPSGTSRLCLSCHDGTIALGNVASRSAEIPVLGGGKMPAGPNNFGTDLSSHHPISFRYKDSIRAGASLAPSPTSGVGPSKKSLLEADGEVQCTSCHDPHDNTNGSFLRLSMRRSELCTTCHQPAGWQQTPHAVSPSQWNQAGANPWPGSKYATVADNGCAGCHTSHQALSKERLVRNATLTGACVVCHNGNVATANVANELTKWSAHPVGRAPGVHDPVEKIDGKATHVECVDCHEPHKTGSGPATSRLEAALLGARGMTASGAPTEAAQAEEEVCYRCHSDDASTNAKRVPRVIEQANQRLKFQPTNPSLHPVGAAGRSNNVPSLIAPLTWASTIRCTSCHANDSGPGAGGTGPAGPHGSRWDYLLERQYVVADNTVETPGTYALCYKCHDRTSILGNVGWAGHSSHVVAQRTPCSACHDPHGISASLGNVLGNSRLMNFDKSIAAPNSKHVLSFTLALSGASQCSLLCHGKDHDALHY